MFDDIQPYICTIKDCKQSPGIMYNISRMWVQHEASHLLTAPRSSECSFCSATYQDHGHAYYAHVSAHLREVSLSVLPQHMADDDADLDTDNSDLPSSHPGSDRMPSVLSATGEVGTERSQLRSDTLEHPSLKLKELRTALGGSNNSPNLYTSIYLDTMYLDPMGSVPTIEDTVIEYERVSGRRRIRSEEDIRSLQGVANGTTGKKEAPSTSEATLAAASALDIAEELLPRINKGENSDNIFEDIRGKGVDREEDDEEAEDTTVDLGEGRLMREIRSPARYTR